MRAWRWVFLSLAFRIASAADPASWRDFDRCFLDNFQQLIDTDDIIRPEARLPERVRLRLTREEARRGFLASEALWKSGFERKEFRDFVASIAAGKRPSSAEAADFKLVRSRIKRLRVAFAAFDERHAYPKAIDRLAAAMGHVQDALKNGAGKAARREAKELLKLLDKSSFAEIEREIAGFRPASRESSEAWFRDQLDELVGLTDRRETTPKGYHEARKVISRIVSVFDVKQAFKPDSETKRVIEYLGSLNGEMGVRHDEIIAETFDGKLNYRKDPIPMPKDLRKRVRRFVQRAVFQ